VDEGEERLTEVTAEAPPTGDGQLTAVTPSPPRRRRKAPEWVKGNTLLLPTTILFAFLLIIPLLIVVQVSLASRSILHPFGNFSWNNLAFHNYSDALNEQFRPIFQRSVVYAAVTTLACIAIGFPLAYWIARFSGRFRNVFLVLVIIPFLTSYLIRMYAWKVVLAPNGLLNTVFGALHLGDNHLFLDTHWAVILGLTYGLLPFMILPLYASIERMDPTLVEASYDLGHGKVSTFFRVIVPSVSPGLVAGILLVFIPAIGDFVTPDLLGGVHTGMIGQTIDDQFSGGLNWPLGSSLSVLLMAFILVGVFFYLWRVGEEAL
jgi:spermidine/putrescine transport system permease protein